jgi:hypothetical protein
MKEPSHEAARPTPGGGSPSAVLGDAVRGWNRFWFTPADPTTLGLIRICCGLIALYTFLAYSFDLQQFFGEHAWMDLKARDEFRKDAPVLVMPTDWSMQPTLRSHAKQLTQAEAEKYMKRWGVNPGVMYGRGNVIWSIWFHVTDPTWMAVIHIGFIVVTFLFTIGFCSRVTAVLTWVGVLSYIQRSPTSVFGMDTMMTIVLIYLVLGPSGAALSVDRLITRWWLTRRALRGQRRATGRGKAEDESAALTREDLRFPVRPSVSANVAIRLLQIHVCIIYLAAGLSKLQGASWWNGTAIWFTLANFEFAPMQHKFYVNMLKALSEHRLLWEVIMTGGAIFTLAFEIGYAFLIWNRYTRWVYLAMAVILHGFIGLFMGLKTFSLIMLVMNAAFIPPEVVHRLLRSLGRGRRGYRLLFNPQDRRQLRAASLVHALDVWDQVELTEPVARLAREPGSTAVQAAVPRPKAPADTPLQLVTPADEALSGRSIFWRLFWTLGIFKILLAPVFVIAIPVRWLLSKLFKGEAASPEPDVFRPKEPAAAGSTHVKAKT